MTRPYIEAKGWEELERWSRRLQDAAWSINIDGTPAQVGLSEAECRELASYLGGLAESVKAGGGV